MGGAVTKPLNDRQRAALHTLASLVVLATYLGGGVAVAIHISHRGHKNLDNRAPFGMPGAPRGESGAFFLQAVGDVVSMSAAEPQWETAGCREGQASGMGCGS